MVEEDLNPSFELVEAAMKNAQLYPHACKNCARCFYVFRRAEEAARGIEKCCVCRYKGEVQESWLTRSIFR